MFIPSVVRLLLGFIKSHVFRLCLQIQARILYRSVGDTHFHGDLFLIGSLESKVRTRTESISSQRIFLYLFAVESSHSGRFLVDDRMEIKRNLSARLIFLHVFGQGSHPTFYDRSIIFDFNLGILYSATLALSIADVEQYSALFTFRESVTLECHTCGGSNLCCDIVVFQQYRIITCCCHLIIVGECRAIAFALTCHGGIAWYSEKLSHGRHQRDATNLKFMQTRESLNTLVTIIIPSSLPARLVTIMTIGRRSGLCHTKRQGTWCHVEIATMSRSYARLYISSKVFFGCTSSIRTRHHSQHANEC